MEPSASLTNVRMFDAHANCHKVVGISLETFTEHHAQQICYSHLTILTAGEVLVYKDLESDFEDIRKTEPFVKSTGEQALESSF